MDDKAKTIDIAVQGLIDALDKTPRIHWGQSIMMALQAAKDLGYADGYRVGSFELEKKQAAAEKTQQAPVNTSGYVASGDHAVPITVGVAGEDKALADNKPTPEEELEDIGFQFIKGLAYQLGLLSKRFDITPASLCVDIEVTQDPVNMGKRARLSINLTNVTERA
jgi:hypothetical protein